MFVLDQNNNQLQKAKVCTFKELNLEERKHLQEWIANEPSSLGEDLLIIQKEFDGFADTKERLDLLAIDKQGRLVIIENKLDDSGRDVTWQAIKYASYCSSLKKSEIIQIFQKYLNGTSNNAEEVIADFMGQSIDDIELNPDNSQRIFFVAANFRKEVTSSVLWLANFGLNIKCFKVTPYLYGERILIDFDQIIPVKDTEDYTIKMASKKQEDIQEAGAREARRTKRSEYWDEFVNYNKKVNGPFATSNGSPDNWLGKSLGISGLTCEVIINNIDTRVEISFNFGDKAANKAAYDHIAAHKQEIENALPNVPITWDRMDDKITCRIRTGRSDLSYQNEDQKEEIFKYLTDTSTAFLKVFGKYSQAIKKIITNLPEQTAPTI